MKKIFILTIASLMLISTSAYAVKESKLATAYSATLWGAGIGIITGLGLAALNTENGEESLMTENRIRTNVLQGFGTGILFGLVFGLFEIGDRLYALFLMMLFEIILNIFQFYLYSTALLLVNVIS